MNWLPYRTLELRSTLSATAAREALASQVEPKRWIRLGSGRCPFEGTVEEYGFAIQRIAQYRNSFLPQIRGEIRADVVGCRVNITMRLHLAVMLPLAVWVTALIVFALGVLVSGATDAVMLFFPLGMILFMVVMCAGAFGFEARKAENMLKEILNATLYV